MEKLLQLCSEATGYEMKEVRDVVENFLSEIAEEMCHGNNVDLGENFGTFCSRRRTSHLPENSPRTAKNTYYKVIFREGRELKRRLKASEGSACGTDL